MIKVLFTTAAVVIAAIIIGLFVIVVMATTFQSCVCEKCPYKENCEKTNEDSAIPPCMKSGMSNVNNNAVC